VDISVALENVASPHPPHKTQVDISIDLEKVASPPPPHKTQVNISIDLENVASPPPPCNPFKLNQSSSKFGSGNQSHNTNLHAINPTKQTHT